MRRRDLAAAVLVRLRSLEGARAAREASQLSQLDVDPIPWAQVLDELVAWETDEERTCGTCQRYGCRWRGFDHGPCRMHRTAAEARADANERVEAP